ncbi:MAG: peptide-methionine (S)-S-oxide reductase [Candidatus Levybacteria bacterium RIFCSPHIGHO2_01_FULL_40_10]|nr:MAG: peptide-methionine (S)-S-oxide reductase [Candidatus Levybacteria bacterium RIFCSPHIGHO2_01_FULL_40_10]
MEEATLAGGCFWCTEGVFQRLKGVVEVVSGYSGGSIENPTYEQVCSGSTGHAEAIQIKFDPKIIPFEKIIEIFFHLHDPTTLNRQGNDVGTQYRSAIFYHNDEQKRTAEEVRLRIEQEKVYQNPIITEIVPFEAFYKAEANHQNFYKNNPDYRYCRVIIDPKIEKLLREYKNEVNES